MATTSHEIAEDHDGANRDEPTASEGKVKAVADKVGITLKDLPGSVFRQILCLAAFVVRGLLMR